MVELCLDLEFVNRQSIKKKNQEGTLSAASPRGAWQRCKVQIKIIIKKKLSQVFSGDKYIDIYFYKSKISNNILQERKV